jgi:hypothetical protein
MNPGRTKASLLLDGLVAGLLGGLTVAIWFLIFDFSNGHPFRTPEMLDAALLHVSPAPAGSATLALRLIEYSVIHFAAFGLFGLLVAWLLIAARPTPGYIFSLVAVFAVFEVFFVALVILLKPELRPWIKGFNLLVANLLATAVMSSYFFLRNPDIGGNLFGSRLSIVTEGILAGLLGGTIVAAWFLLLDINVGAPLRTSAALGAAFLGNGNPNEHLSLFVLGYTVMHFAVFIVLGIVSALVLSASHSQPPFRIGLVLLFAVLEIFFFGVITMVDDSLFDVISSTRVTLGNLLACLGMVGFLYLRHRGLEAWRYLLPRRSSPGGGNLQV